MKMEHSSLMSDALELKNKHLSYPVCTCNLPPVVIRGGKTKLPFWNAGTWYLKFITGSFSLSLPNQEIIAYKLPSMMPICCMAPIFNMFSVCTCVRVACSWPMWSVWRTFSCVGFFTKGVLNPFTIAKLPGSFVSISRASKKCFDLPASGMFGAILAENKLFTYG